MSVIFAKARDIGYLLSWICFIVFVMMSCDYRKTGIISLISQDPQGKLTIFASLSSQNAISQGVDFDGEVSTLFPLHNIGVLTSGEHRQLAVGTYVLLAQCSYQVIHVKENTHRQVALYRVAIIPPRKTVLSGSYEGFSVSCRSDKHALFSQKFHHPHTLSMFSGSHRFMINQVLTEVEVGDGISWPQIALAALRVDTANTLQHSPSTSLHYFVSKDAQPTFMHAVELGHWSYFLAGDYVVSIGGQSQKISLKAAQILDIPTATLRFQVDRSVSMDRITHNMRSPYMIRLHHYDVSIPLQINTSYPILSGKASYTLGFSETRFPILIHPLKDVTIPLNTFMVSNACNIMQSSSPCRDGNIQVHVYLSKGLSPWISAVSDIPIPVPQSISASQMQIELSTSHGLKMPFPSKQGLHQNIELAKLVIEPRNISHSHRNTVLVRLERHSHQGRSTSKNLSHQSASTLYLLPGKYSLVSYTSIQKTGEKFAQRQEDHREFEIQAGQTLKILAEFYHDIEDL